MNIKAVCLGLDKRKDMWSELSNQVKQLLGIDLEIFVAGNGSNIDLNYNHIDTDQIGYDFTYTRNPSHYNAYLCHKKIFQQAVDNDVDILLFLEDDAYIIAQRISLLNTDEVSSFIFKQNWDVIYLGWWMKRTGYISEDREDLEEVWLKHGLYGINKVPTRPYLQHECCGLHGILINRTILKQLTNAEYGPIDTYLHTNFNKINAYFLWPKLIHTHSTWSYCENSMCNRNLI